MKNIVIVGCGFIGSHLADELVKLCFSQDIFPIQFTFIDFDRWEERNAANQNVNGTIARMGAFKADTCRDNASLYHPDITAISINEKLTAENANLLLKEATLIIDCVDNIPTRQLLWAYGSQGKVAPVMHCGIARNGSGQINWSTTILDTFPFKPQFITGRDLQEQDIKEPPCEMYKYRSSGLILFSAIARAFAFYHGKDPWEQLKGANENGILTCWSTNENGMKLLVDDMFLVDEFFPIFKNVLKE